MKAQHNSQAQAKKEHFSILQYGSNKVAFEEINGKIMVNATQMAKPFGKQPIEWLRYQQSKDLIETVAKVRNHSLVDLQVVKRGGNNPGTWFQEDVALFFAQWLSPEFYLACNAKLKELLSNKAQEFPAQYGIAPIVYNGELLYNYSEVCKKLGNVKSPCASTRKKRSPENFRLVFGRNFITQAYFDLLHMYYSYKAACRQCKIEDMSNQLKLGL